MPKRAVVRSIDLGSYQGSKSGGSTIIQITGEGGGIIDTGEVVKQIVDTMLDGLPYAQYIGPSCWLLDSIDNIQTTIRVSAQLFRTGSWVALQHYSVMNPVDPPEDRDGYEIISIDNDGEVSEAGGYTYNVTRAVANTQANAYPAYNTMLVQLTVLDEGGGYFVLSSGIPGGGIPNVNVWAVENSVPVWKSRYGRLTGVPQSYKDLFPEVLPEEWDTHGIALTNAFLSGLMVADRIIIQDDITSRGSITARPYNQPDAISLGETPAGNGLAVLSVTGRPWFTAVHPTTLTGGQRVTSNDQSHRIETTQGELIDEFTFDDSANTWARMIGAVIQSERDKLAFFSSSPIAKPTITGVSLSEAEKNLLAALGNYGLITNSTTYSRPLTFIVKDTTYQAVVGDLVLADASGGDFTITAPTSPNANDRFGVKLTDTSRNIVTVTAGSTTIENPYPLTVENTSVKLFSIGALVIWQYDGTQWFIVGSTNVDTYKEVWYVTAASSIASGGTTLTWTFDANLSDGDTAMLASYATGVWTFGLDIMLKVNLSIRTEFALSSTNQDALVDITDSFSGAGANRFAGIASVLAHTRSGNFDFSASCEGAYNVADGDTLSFVASSDASQTGSTNIVEGIIVFTVG